MRPGIHDDVHAGVARLPNIIIIITINMIIIGHYQPYSNCRRTNFQQYIPVVVVVVGVFIVAACCMRNFSRCANTVAYSKRRRYNITIVFPHTFSHTRHTKKCLENTPSCWSFHTAHSNGMAHRDERHCRRVGRLGRASALCVCVCLRANVFKNVFVHCVRFGEHAVHNCSMHCRRNDLVFISVAIAALSALASRRPHSMPTQQA